MPACALGAAEEVKAGRRGFATRMEWIYSVRSLGAAAQGAGQPEAIDPTEIEDGEAEAENETYLEDDWEKPDRALDLGRRGRVAAIDRSHLIRMNGQPAGRALAPRAPAIALEPVDVPVVDLFAGWHARRHGLA